ncbi:MAG: prepilin-type N-terminal cleavage/methylation domain-containing protein, partial [bacterium]|nr:prepilin-type N-terminal cleavage/methylation domain-containing protein [bacterium]
MRCRTSLKSGFTMIELLIVIAILGALLLFMALALARYQGKARDSERKADLDRIKIAFEDYYNDNSCYPPPEVLNDCGGASLQPHLNTVPCDPLSKDPYVYIPLDGNECKGYRILGNLEDDQDSAIANLGCDASCGCGFGNEYNYGIASGTPLLETGCSAVATTPTPTPAASSGGGGG